MCRDTVCFLDEGAVRVDSSSSLGLQLSQSEDVLQAIQCHLHNLGVHQGQKVTERLNATQLHQMPV